MDSGLSPARRDAALILAARSARAFGYGFVAVILGLYLEQLGFSPFRIGVVLTAALAGSAAFSVLLGLWADRLGRRRVLILCAAFMAASGAVFALSSHPVAFLLAALTGTISATSGETSAFLPIEQAILPQTTSDRRRTSLFALYNMLGTLAASLGALFSGVVVLLQQHTALDGADAYRPLFAGYAALAVGVAFIYSFLSPEVELPPDGTTRSSRLPTLRRSRRPVAGLSALFAVDALGGGFIVQSLIALWFHTRFDLGPGTLSLIFFVSSLLAAASFPVAAYIARRIGLIKTMVFTHIPSSIFLMAMPLAPGAGLAVTLFLLRQSLSQMDVPTRQSYTMAIVPPEERTAAAGITNVSRTVAQAASPAIAGYAIQTLALGAPFVIAGAIKIAYDLALYFTFGKLKPPEEMELRDVATRSVLKARR